MFITELSIKRPTVSWVMSLILIVFGLFVFWKLPVRELPNGIQPPVVQIQVDYKSAAASVVDQEVTQVVEDVIGGAEGIKNIDSKSENGRSTINVEFDTSIDLDNAAKTFMIMEKCVDSIVYGDKTFNRIDMTEKELTDFIDSMTTEQIEGVIEFFDTMPKIRHVVEVTNPNTKKKSEVVLEGLENFLEF